MANCNRLLVVLLMLAVALFISSANCQEDEIETGRNCRDKYGRPIGCHGSTPHTPQHPDDDDNSNDDDDDDDDNKDSAWRCTPIIVGVVVGLIAMIAIIVVTVVCVRKRRWILLVAKQRAFKKQTAIAPFAGSAQAENKKDGGVDPPPAYASPKSGKKLQPRAGGGGIPPPPYTVQLPPYIPAHDIYTDLEKFTPVK